MPAAKCKVCDAKNETIHALELTIQALNEMVNLQRALPVGPPAAFPSIQAPVAYPPLRAAGPEDEPPTGPPPAPDLEEAMDRLNYDPDLSDEQAERLLTEVQAFNTTVERD